MRPALRQIMDWARPLVCDRDGAMAIETALVAPMLVLMAIGSFQVSSIVARQSELQNAAAEAAAIALASPPETQEQLDTVRDVLKASTGLDDEDVTVDFTYRCGDATLRVDNVELCAADDTVWTYMHIRLEAIYEPIWTRLGVGSNVDMVVDRFVQVS